MAAANESAGAGSGSQVGARSGAHARTGARVRLRGGIDESELRSHGPSVISPVSDRRKGNEIGHIRRTCASMWVRMHRSPAVARRKDVTRPGSTAGERSEPRPGALRLRPSTGRQGLEEVEFPQILPKLRFRSGRTARAATPPSGWAVTPLSHLRSGRDDGEDCRAASDGCASLAAQLGCFPGRMGRIGFCRREILPSMGAHGNHCNPYLFSIPFSLKGG